MEKTILYLALLLIVIHLFILRISIMQKRDKQPEDFQPEIKRDKSDSEGTTTQDEGGATRASS
ncbi:MAG: hypothetical protein F4X44_01175 [Gammaproteobacteria bacterium]|nr:hypothetical protein [Gammaproteobacteria bacterium]MYD79214.1 hypothetical protein [Gammaproteobacteria bacterium]